LSKKNSAGAITIPDFKLSYSHSNKNSRILAEKQICRKMVRDSKMATRGRKQKAYFLK
jgi:hypothetical protein